jgi:hypothetical protein
MGYWENTTYIKHGNVKEVVQTLDAVFAQEGMLRVPAPSQRTRLAVEPMQYDGALDNDLWGFAVFPGAPGWTVVKTAPLEVLSERAAAAVHMRLVEVCRSLGASAFQLNVYDSSGTVLVEVSAEGAVFLSGLNMNDENPLEWHGLEITEERIQPAFELHDLMHLLSDPLSGDDMAQAIAREIAGPNSAHCDNLVSVDTLICHKPFEVPEGLSLYYRWSGPSRQRRTPSNTYAQYGFPSGEAKS